MRTATLTRSPSTDDGTFGKLVLDDGTTFFTGELPWRDNKNGTSCIPPGPEESSIVYLCKRIDSPKHGPCYQVTGVPHRDMIEIHSANYMGDSTKGKICQLLGCIALGMSIGILNGQMAVLRSKVAIAAFEKNLNEENFELTIK
jgi:hypothetical protein